MWPIFVSTGKICLFCKHLDNRIFCRESKEEWRLSHYKNMANMEDGMNLWERSVKRLFDIVASFLGFILLLAVFLVLCFCLGGAVTDRF